MYMILYVFLIGILSVMDCSIAPFIEPNTVHQTNSELELNLIANENRYSAILVAIYNQILKKDEEGLKGLLENVFRYEPYSGFGLMVDCRKFEENLKGQMHLCDKAQKNEEGVTVIAFYPQSFMIDLKGHEMAGNHDTEVILDT